MKNNLVKPERKLVGRKTKWEKVGPELAAKVAHHYLQISHNYRETARQFGMSQNTVRAVVARVANDDELAQILTEKKKQYLDLAWDMEFEMLEELRKRIKEMKDGNLMTFYGIHDDKRTRAAGEATSIVEQRKVGWEFRVNSDGSLFCRQCARKAEK